MCQIQSAGSLYTFRYSSNKIPMEESSSKGSVHLLGQHAETKSLAFTSLEFLCVDSFWPGKKHPLIQNVGCVSDVPRIHTKLKLVTGVYVLQVNRARFNQNLIDTRCQLCFHADETVAHFLLDCPVFDLVRRPALEAITRIGRELHCPTDSDNLLQLILDSSCFTNIARDMVSHGSYRDLDMQTRRLCHTLHIERYKRLALIPKRTRK